MEKTYDEYRALLKQAIGARSQTEFAAISGLSRALINNTLGKAPVSRPSKRTLKKIAIASNGVVSYQSLLTACGYEDEVIEDTKELEERKSFTFLERTSRSVQELKEGFERLGANRQIYKDLADYIDMVNVLYSIEKTTFKIGEERDFGDVAHPTADGSVIITASWQDADSVAEMEVLVWFARLINGNMIIIDVVFDKDALEKAGSPLISNLESAKQDPDFVTTPVFGNTVYQVCHKREEKHVSRITSRSFDRRVKAFMNHNGLSEKDAIFAAIFGDPDRPKRIMSVEGIGFYLDDIPAYLVRQFILNHAETFIRSEEEAQIADALQGEEPLDGVFKNYKCDIDRPERGTWMVAVNNIIYRETGIEVTLWGTFDDFEEKRELHNRPVLMLDAGMPWEFDEKVKGMTGDEFRQLLDKYARELRTYAHSVYYLMRVDVEDEDVL